MTFISFIDWLLLPGYLLIIFLIAKIIQNRLYPIGHPWRNHFMNGLIMKIFSAIAICIVYQYYYRGLGDTFSYYNDGLIITEAFFDSPIKWFKLLFAIPQWYDGDYMQYVSKFNYYDTKSNYYICSLVSILSLLSFKSFIIISVLFSVISFTGIWALYRTFSRQYSNISNSVAWAILYIPSVSMWGSGIFKDTVCLFGLGWLTFSSFKLLINLSFSLKYVLIALSSLILIATIKVYILVAFIPAIAFWSASTHLKRVQNPFSKLTLRIVVFIGLFFGILFLNNYFKEALGFYSLDMVLKTSENLRNNLSILTESEGATGYDLGPISPNNIFGLLKKAPAAINVSLFRPYLWESKKLLIFLNSIESFILFWLTIYVIKKVGIKRTLKAISASPNLQFFLLFTLVFAFAIGISTYNFGTLSRYRIPCLPFYSMFLCLLYYEYGGVQKEEAKVISSVEH